MSTRAAMVWEPATRAPRPYFILAAAQRLSIRLHTTYDIA